SVLCWQAGACSSQSTLPGADGGSSGGDGGASVDAGLIAPCNPGPSWAVVDDYTHSDTAPQTDPSGITVGPAGDLYVAGTTMGFTIGLIRKSTDGPSWSLLEEQPKIGSGPIAIAPGGAFFASGTDGTGQLVSRSRDGGLSWAVVDTVAHPG